ncbi:insulin-degrading enzyme-like [Tropilaelaps mercedesae]|uniref:Insulin-degrading enzyme-like n=1 Tax=Tropilaelaps mercedesae TaxID=418985 RepID=A0A1V9XET3_9ACAR|nr:insulin-degrading enzyme-like [Tropilaelaps mercedesae]
MSQPGSLSRFDMDSLRTRSACTCLPPWIFIVLVVAFTVIAILLPNVILQLFSAREQSELPEGITFIARDILKPSYDVSMQYEGIELRNGLRVLLGSDAKAEQASVVLCVYVGSLSNPRELQGLAHFTEHMLFMGSKKYPGENALDAFISKHGSFPNAHTYRSATCYFYEIDPDYLEESLDIFTAAFEAPLVKQSLIEREIIAVDNEHRDSIGDDRVRQDRIDEVTADLDHAYSRFTTGNIESLQKAAERLDLDIRQAVMDFVSKYYSSNVMSALIYSRHTLPQLESLAAKALSSLTNRHTTLPHWTSPYRAEHMGLLTKIVPIEDETKLKLVFPLPDFQKYYKTRPELYLATLLGHEGVGSIYSYLRKKGKVTHMEATTKGDTMGHYHIDISFKLPKEEVDYVDDIITALFEYVDMLKTSGPKQWLFEELVQVHNNSFQYRRKDITVNALVQLCRDLQNFPWRDALAGSHVFDTYDEDLIRRFTDLIDPSRMRVFIVSKRFENSTDMQEHYYKIDYKTEPIPVDKIERWKTTKNRIFTLPELNHFIPDNFRMAPHEDYYTCIPKLVINNPSFHMWFMQDRSLNTPYTTTRVMFRHPVLLASAENVAGLEMMIRVFQYSIAEPFYNAHLSGFDIHVGRYNGGLCIYVDGYNQHIHALVQRLMERLAVHRIAQWRTAFVKLKKEYEAYLLMTIHERHMDVFKLPDFVNPYLQENYFTVSQLLTALANCTVERTQQILNVLRNDSTVEAFVYGNSISAEAKAVADTITTTFKRGSLSFSETPAMRQVKLHRGVAYRQYKVNAQLSSNYLYMFFEVRAGDSEDRLAALCALFVKLIKEPLFNVIRTNEQLAYMVQAVEKGQQGSFGVAFYLVTSHKLSYVEERLAHFLRNYFKTFLAELPDNVFLEQKEAAMKQKLKRPQKMEDITGLFWQEMIDQSYLLQRITKEGAAMRTLSKNDLNAFYEEFFVQVTSTTVYALYLSNSTDKSRVQWSTDNYIITSLDSFRQDHEYHTFEKDHSVAHMTPLFK